MKKRYRSKIDLWVGALLGAAVVAMFVSLFSIASSGEEGWVILLQAAIAVVVIMFVLSIVINTHYTITNQDIRVRSGPFRWTVPISDIDLIEPSRKAWSSAALSLDRLYIEYRDSEAGILISPVDKDQFMRDAAGRDPKLQFDGVRVARS